jgi:hypothetical protein
MGEFITTQPKKIMDMLKRYNSVRLYGVKSPYTIASLQILTSILNKELIKYEVNILDTFEAILHDDDTFDIFVDLLHEGIPSSLHIGIYTEGVNYLVSDYLCEDGELRSVFTVYSLAKHLNFVNNDILWSLIVVFSYKHLFLCRVEENDEEDEEEERTVNIECETCSKVYLDVVLEVQKHNSNNGLESIHESRRVNFPFLSSTTLYEAIENDLDFVIKNKLYRKRKDKEVTRRKICEELASIGISRREAGERFVGLCIQSKQMIYTKFERRMFFERNCGYDLKITAIENYFILMHYLATNEPMLGFLSLNRRMYINHGSGFAFYRGIMEMIKSSVNKIKRVGNKRIIVIYDLSTFNMEGYKEDILMNAFYEVLVIFLKLMGKCVGNLVIVLENYGKSDSLIVSNNNRGLDSIEGRFLDCKRMCFSTERKRLRLAIESIIHA